MSFGHKFRKNGIHIDNERVHWRFNPHFPGTTGQGDEGGGRQRETHFDNVVSSTVITMQGFNFIITSL